MRNFFLYTIFALFLFRGVGSLPAQEETPETSPAFAINNLTVRTYEKMHLDLDDSAKGGYIETFESKTEYLVEIEALISPNWSEDRQKIVIDYKKILLSSPEGKNYPMVGRFTHGYFEKQTWNSFSAYRPSKWAESTAMIPYNVVYLVPRETKKVVFALGEISKETELPEKCSPIPVPADSVQVDFLSAKLVTKIPGGDLSRDVEKQSSIQPLTGPLLEVTFKVTPKSGNTKVDNHFFWFTSWVGLIAGEKTYFPTLGERWGTGISLNVSHNKSKFNQKWNSEEVTFYFAFPSGETEFEITWLCRPVAKGSLKN